jgi:hypothetical protein
MSLHYILTERMPTYGEDEDEDSTKTRPAVLEMMTRTRMA